MKKSIRFFITCTIFVLVSGGYAHGALYNIDFNDFDGSHWTGVVDTSTDSLTITSWVENLGGIPFWTPAVLSPFSGMLAVDAS